MESWFLPLLDKGGALSNIIKFVKTKHPERVETLNTNQVTTHPPSSLDFIICRSCTVIFSLFLALAALVLSCFFGHSLQALLFFHTGSLLLAVHFYQLTRAAPLIPSTALGVLLLILSSILAYAGKSQRVSSFRASPFYSFACIWSALPTGLSKLWQPCQTINPFS